MGGMGAVMKTQMNNQTGSTLLEMMIALFVLAIGLLGVLSMQVKSMQFNQSAYYYTQAVYLANDILESMRSAPASANTYLIELDEATPEASADCEDPSVVCTAAQLRDWTISNWRQNVTNTLAAGRSAISSNGNFFTITVQFDDSRSEAAGTEGPTLSEYVLVTEIN